LIKPISRLKAKGSESKRAERNVWKRAIKRFKKGNGKKKKKSKFWLMHMHQIKIFYIFVPNLGKLYLFGKK